MVHRIHQTESEMLFLTSEEKRRNFISNAILKHTSGDPGWFKELKARIDNGLLANPRKREEVILKWLRTAEQVGSQIVREEIMQQYAK